MRKIVCVKEGMTVGNFGFEMLYYNALLAVTAFS